MPNKHLTAKVKHSTLAKYNRLTATLKSRNTKVKAEDNFLIKKEYDQNEVSSGSYGHIFRTSDPNKIVKIHLITGAETCKDYQHEFKMQQNIYNDCNKKIKTLGGVIAFPFKYHYRTRLSIAKKELPIDCRILMEKIPSYDDNHPMFLKKLEDIIKTEYIEGLKDKDLRKIPPYLFLGTDIDEDDEYPTITLKMLKDLNPINVTQLFTYYKAEEGTAYDLIQDLFYSFFILCICKYRPRDIEYVFNCKKYDSISKTYFAIIDFNQVTVIPENDINNIPRTVIDRNSQRIPYVLERDLAHVYIDICGLRSSGDRNPYNTESGTPMWKFLCNPLKTPDIFIDSCIGVTNGYIAETAKKQWWANFNFSLFVNEITNYIERSHMVDIYERKLLRIAEIKNSVKEKITILYSCKLDGNYLYDYSLYNEKNNDYDNRLMLELKALDRIIQKYYIINALVTLNSGVNISELIDSIYRLTDYDEIIRIIMDTNKATINAKARRIAEAREAEKKQDKNVDPSALSIFDTWGGGAKTHKQRKYKVKDSQPTG
jgi:hypothetical protein